MTKQELCSALHSGQKLENLFEWRSGQDCDIFKADRFSIGNEIIYIPDVYLNDLFTLNDIDDILDCCYTGEDFLAETGGNAAKAERLFWFCDWQHPSSAWYELYDEEDW